MNCSLMAPSLSTAMLANACTTWLSPRALKTWVIDSMTGDLGLMSYVDKITILPHITFLMGLLLVLVVMA